MGTVKEEFAKMGIYDGIVLIDPKRLFLFLPTVQTDDEKEEIKRKIDYTDHYDKG